MADGKPYQRDPNAYDVEFEGMNSWLPFDRMPPNKFPYAANVRRNRTGNIVGRPQQSGPVITLDSTIGGVHTIRRMNDSTPAGPASGYVLISGQEFNLNADAVVVDSTLSGKRFSITPFRPNQSVQPWAYIADDSSMVKVRSDKTKYKTGIKEPQVPATVSFAGGGGTVVPGINSIQYKYVYRSTATGAVSNPGPASTPGANAQGSSTKTDSATGAPASLFTFDSSQYEFNSNQIRTKGIPSGMLTNYIVAHNFGFAIPDGMNIDGISVDLNWLGQQNGTGILSTVSLFYGGNVLGISKNPAAANTTIASDAIYGGAFDSWGTRLTSAMVNDTSFGFGVQITTVQVSGTNRSFVNTMAVTVYYSAQDATITPTQSLDPQVNKVDYYRFGKGLENYTYVGTTPNDGSSFHDTLDDLIAQANKVLEFDNFEPYPSIDLPRAGVVSTDSTTAAVSYISGDQFNIRWLPGTDVVIAGVPYIADRRPASTTSWIIPGVPTDSSVSYEIAQPFLAQQPMRRQWGPTDNVAFMFACGDFLRPGTLYFTKGNNPDSAPQTNSIEVTSPSEPLMNGCIVGGMSMVFSTERAWLDMPNFFDAFATVTGTIGSAFTLTPAITDRGLYAVMGLCVAGGKDAYFISKDGIYVSPGGHGSISITDADLYNIFPHEGVPGQDVTYGNTGITLFAPDYSQPDEMELSFANGYLYFDYVDTESKRRTLVYDPTVKGWCVDAYDHVVWVHANEEGTTTGTLMGCSDGTIRRMV